MRVLLLALCLLLPLGEAAACSCFTPEFRAKTTEDAINGARVAAFGMVTEVSAEGTARVRVEESFKGLGVGEFIDLPQAVEKCGERASRPGEATLLIIFSEQATACDKYPADHYLLNEFRQLGKPQ